MIEQLTAEGYEQTKEKLLELKQRIADIEERTDLKPEHMASVQNSYRNMMREYLQEIKLYETKQRRTERS